MNMCNWSVGSSNCVTRIELFDWILGLIWLDYGEMLIGFTDCLFSTHFEDFDFCCVGLVRLILDRILAATRIKSIILVRVVWSIVHFIAESFNWSRWLYHVSYLRILIDHSTVIFKLQLFWLVLRNWRSWKVEVD